MKTELSPQLGKPTPQMNLSTPKRQNPLLTKDPKALKESTDYQVNLSKEALEKSELAKETTIQSNVSTSKPSLNKPDVPEVKDMAKEISKDEVKEKATKEITNNKVENKAEPKVLLKKPGIFFVEGLGIFSSNSASDGGYEGIRKMADSVEGARLYAWDQKKEILEQIKKIDPSYPVIIVGHSFGGDTAVEVAEELNSLDYGFRKVDYLVTLDSVGFNNDIIPQNVKNHLNIFGENNVFLNDGPNVAKNHEMTKVENILSHLDHTELDDHKEYQFKIITQIQDLISKV